MHSLTQTDDQTHIHISKCGNDWKVLTSVPLIGPPPVHNLVTLFNMHPNLSPTSSLFHHPPPPLSSSFLICQVSHSLWLTLVLLFIPNSSVTKMHEHTKRLVTLRSRGPAAAELHIIGQTHTNRKCHCCSWHPLN